MHFHSPAPCVVQVYPSFIVQCPDCNFPLLLFLCSSFTNGIRILHALTHRLMQTQPGRVSVLWLVMGSCSELAHHLPYAGPADLGEVPRMKISGGHLLACIQKPALVTCKCTFKDVKGRSCEGYRLRTTEAHSECHFVTCRLSANVRSVRDVT